MKPKLSDWASVAEIIASAAVVATLIMLMMNVRENTQVVRATSYDNLLSDINEQAFVIVANERLDRIWRHYVNRATNELTDDERFTLLLLLRSTFRTFEKAYFAYQYGTVGPAENARFDEQACNHIDMAGAGLWAEISEVLTSGFRRHIDDLCGQRSSDG